MAIFTNRATLTYSGGTVNSNVTTGEIVEVLSASKTAVVEQYGAGGEVTYVINVVNSGAVPFNGLTVADDLGEYLTEGLTLVPLDYVDGSVRLFVDGVLQATPSVTPGPPLVISGINIPAGGVATLVYTTVANGYASPLADGVITNTAIISGGTLTPVTVSETVNAVVGPELSITKSVSPTTVTENGQITYTLTINNVGNTDAVVTDNVVITDTFDPILTGISVTYNGEAWTSPEDYSYDENTGVFTTAVGAITVPAATFTQDPVTGLWQTVPGTAVITVTGTL